MSAVGLGQQGPEAVGPGSNLCSVKYFQISLTFVGICNCPHGTVVRTKAFGNGGYGFNSEPLPTFFNFFNTTENRETPLPFIHKSFLIAEKF